MKTRLDFQAGFNLRVTMRPYAHSWDRSGVRTAWVCRD